MEFRSTGPQSKGLIVAATGDSSPGPAIGPALKLLEETASAEHCYQPAGSSQFYDAPSGLPTYESFRNALELLLQHNPGGHEVALVWIDLLSLKREFYLRGWAGAESLARRIADALRENVDDTALLGRLNGQCFVLAMPAAKYDRRDRRRIQTVVDALNCVQTRTPEGDPQIASGVAFYPADTSSPDDLVRFASLAAMRAGYLRSSKAMSFQASMNSLLMRDYQLETEMSNGLRRGQFTTVYQPVVNLNDGALLTVETLIRWNHPVWGPVTPAEFVPVAERSGLINDIFDLTTRTALADAGQWKEAGLAVPVISVNASAVNLRREEFVSTVKRLLRESPLSSAKLTLEVTESVLFDDEDLFALRVRQLKEIGVQLAIDDFGTRYTGFNTLKHVPLDAMKIDKCFIRGIHSCRDTRALYQTIVAMARQLRLCTVAEGIETHAELETLRTIGCEAGQGYLIQRPVDALRFAQFLREWPGRKHKLGFGCAPFVSFAESEQDEAS
jgi:EAL domain-containing protein (putative c-di-GMP-specific phosphodiesterase class I)/GGDEF domain-containing protein